MKKYCVSIPATMAIHIYVEAETEEKAIEKAFEVEFTLNLDGLGVEIGEFETHHTVCRGNVLSAVLNSVEVEEI